MNRFFQALIRLYQLVLSPLFPPCCRYLPTCSEYAKEAFSRHGVFTGMRLTLTRLARCHPFCRGGYDPVPPKANKKQLNPQPTK